MTKEFFIGWMKRSFKYMFKLIGGGLLIAVIGFIGCFLFDKYPVLAGVLLIIIICFIFGYLDEKLECKC